MKVGEGIEIMSPVGSYEALTAAINAGAASVYFGVGKLNMRSRSSFNFAPSDIISIADQCNKNNVRAYLALNTVMYDEDLELMRELVDSCCENGIHAVIASDMAVMEYAKKRGVEVHVSTQCNITNLEAVRYYSRFADVVVTARELTIEQVSAIADAIKKENISGPSGKLLRLEVFVHGALCMAISGKCTLSQDIFNSSANRGACYQPCRRSYIVTDKEEGFELEIDNQYVMSPKDLCTIGFLDKIINAGVRILKIEGRGRSPEYVSTVTACYREAAAAVLDGKFSSGAVNQWLERLKRVYNRGFWEGYYLGRTTGEWAKRHGSVANWQKIYVGKVMNYFAHVKVAEIKAEASSLSVGDNIIYNGPSTGVLEDTVIEMLIDMNPAQKAEPGNIFTLPVNGLVRRSDKLYKKVPANRDSD